jgi:hypothetical protein
MTPHPRRLAHLWLVTLQLDDGNGRISHAVATRRWVCAEGTAQRFMASVPRYARAQTVSRLTEATQYAGRNTLARLVSGLLLRQGADGLRARA